MHIFNRRTKGGLAIAAVLVGVFLLAQRATADGRLLPGALRGAGNCPAEAPCITEVVTEGILPYNQPFIRGTAGLEAEEIVITVDGGLRANAWVKKLGWFDEQVPWSLAEGLHYVYVQSVLPDGSLSAISNIVDFRIEKPAVEPQISATRVEEEDEAEANASTTDAAGEQGESRDSAVPSPGRPWGRILWYAAAFAIIATLLYDYRRRHRA